MTVLALLLALAGGGAAGELGRRSRYTEAVVVFVVTVCVCWLILEG